MKIRKFNENNSFLVLDNQEKFESELSMSYDVWRKRVFEIIDRNPSNFKNCHLELTEIIDDIYNTLDRIYHGKKEVEKEIKRLEILNQTKEIDIDYYSSLEESLISLDEKKSNLKKFEFLIRTLSDNLNQSSVILDKITRF